MIGMTRVLHKNYWNVMFILLQNYVKDDRKNKRKKESGMSQHGK